MEEPTIAPPADVVQYSDRPAAAPLVIVMRAPSILFDGVAAEHDGDLLVGRRHREDPTEAGEGVVGRVRRREHLVDRRLDVDDAPLEHTVGARVTGLGPERVEVLLLTTDDRVGVPRPQRDAGVHAVGHGALRPTGEPGRVEVAQHLARLGVEVLEGVTGAAGFDGVDDLREPVAEEAPRVVHHRVGAEGVR